jgi:hypothetical protein
MNIDKVCR